MEAVKQTGKTITTTAAAHATGKAAAPFIARSTTAKNVTRASPVPAFIQPKLQVNKPGDRFEKEANTIADRVMRAHSNQDSARPVNPALKNRQVRTLTSRSIPPVISRLTAETDTQVSRKCKHCEHEEKIQRKATNSTAEKAVDVSAELKNSKAGGNSLPAPVNAFMSRSIGADFSRVRVHTDARAAAMSRALNAHAFTNGSDVYFNTGMYDPESPAGKHLLAHELTHVVQQGYAPVTDNAIVNPGQTADIQRFELGDLEGLNPLDINVDDLVRKYMPELFELKNAGGLVPWLEKKISGAVETMMNAAVAPVKGAVDFISGLSPTMAKIINWIKTAGVKISKNDCSSFTELGEMIEQLADELAAPAIEKIKELSQKASAWFSEVWQKFGLPVWDFIKGYIGDQWELIKSLGNTIWEKTAPVRTLAASLWVKFKNWLGIGDGPEGQNGIIQWIEGKLLAIWEKIKQKVEPFKKQLMIAGGVLLMLSPAGPFIAIGALFAGVVTAVNWIRKNLSSPKDIALLRVKFEKEILPAVMRGLTAATGALKEILGGITGKLTSVVGALGSLASIVADGVLSFIQSALVWITAKFNDLAEWAATKLTDLGIWLQKIFDGVRSFATLIIHFLEKVNAVANNIMSLPGLIIGGLWAKIPLCIRNGIEDFLVNMILKNIPFFEDVVALIKYWQKIKAGALDAIKTVFITGDLKGGVLKVFKLLLDVLGIPVQLVTGIYNKAITAFDEIVNKPKVIFANIVEAVKAGFSKFKNNFLKNAIDAIGNWIFSQVKEVKMPKNFSLQSVFGVVMDILGITENNIFKRIELKTSKPFADKLRKVYEGVSAAGKWIVNVIKDPKAAYEQAKDKVKELKTTLFKSIGSWISKNVIGVFMAKIAAELASTPFGEAIEAIIDTYKMIKTAIEYAEKILRVVDSVLDGILDLAAGVITKAADAVEKGLVTGMEAAVAFIAKVIGLGDLPVQVKKIVEQDIRPIIDSGIDFVIDGIIKFVKTLKEFINDAKDAVLDAFNWSKTKQPFTDAKGESHSVYIENKNGVPVLMVASTPKPGIDLINTYRTKNAGSADKVKKADQAGDQLRIVKSIADNLAKLDSALKKSSNEAEKKQIQKDIDFVLQALLKQEVLLTTILNSMLGKSDYATNAGIYEAEGRVGVHALSPKNAGVKFQADHQPSNQLLILSAQRPNASPFLKEMAAKRSATGYTIVIGNYRHYEGRTYGGNSAKVINQFLAVVTQLLKGETDEKRKVIPLEHALKDSAIRDAEQMEQVVSNTDLKAKQWRDINELNLDDDEKQALRSQIERQVKSGERIIKSTNVSLTVG
jgi:hypothetical protein